MVQADNAAVVTKITSFILGSVMLLLTVLICIKNQRLFSMTQAQIDEEADEYRPAPRQQPNDLDESDIAVDFPKNTLLTAANAKSALSKSMTN